MISLFCIEKRFQCIIRLIGFTLISLHLRGHVLRDVVSKENVPQGGKRLFYDFFYPIDSIVMELVELLGVNAVV